MKRVGLAEAIEAVRAELFDATHAAHGNDLRLLVGQVNIEFEVVAERAHQGRGGLKFWVVEAGAQHEQSTTRSHRVAVMLTPELRGEPLYTSEESVPD